MKENRKKGSPGQTKTTSRFVRKDARPSFDRDVKRLLHLCTSKSK